MASPSPPLFTAVSFFSLAAIASVSIIAYLGSAVLLPKKYGFRERATFIWLAFDAVLRFGFEGSFLYLSTFGRTVRTSTGPIAQLWKEYALADSRFESADSTLVSVEILTVFGIPPLCCYIIRQLIRDDPARHYWIIVLCTAELYGGWMTFCPEWLTGNQNLNTSNFLYFWVYLVFMNSIWVFIPISLMIDSYQIIAGSLRKGSMLRDGKRD